MPPSNAARKANSEALVQAILQGESDNALYWSCMCLRNKEIEQLEDAWIEVSARIGAKQVMPYRDTWIQTNRTLWNLIQSDEMHVSDVLQMTGKLYILYHKQTHSSDDKTKHVIKLRKEIIDFFPEGATLSYRGQQQLGRIIPNPGAPSHDFVQRVLAGLSRLIEKEDTLNIHRALEYISRKKLQIPLPHVWPAPTTELADKGDPVWFLWGAMLLFFHQNSDVALLWELYTHQWKATCKGTRAGLLWGVAHMLQNGVSQVWLREEIHILEKVAKLAPELWASVNEVEGSRELDEDVAEEEPVQDLDRFHSFLPRTDPRAIARAASHVAPYQEQLRVLNIKGDKERLVRSDIGIAKEDPKNIKGDKDIQNLSSVTRHQKNDQTSDIDPRYRWLYYGTERK